MAAMVKNRASISVVRIRKSSGQKWYTTLTVMHHFPLTSETVRTVFLLAYLLYATTLLPKEILCYSSISLKKAENEYPVE